MAVELEEVVGCGDQAPFRAGGREELAAIEEAEIATIERFLPAQMSEGEARAAIELYPRQLHEMEQADYLAMKRKEFALHEGVQTPVAFVAPSKPDVAAVRTASTRSRYSGPEVSRGTVARRWSRFLRVARQQVPGDELSARRKARKTG